MPEDLVAARADWVARFGDAAGSQFDRAISGQLPPPDMTVPAVQSAAPPAAPTTAPAWSMKAFEETVTALRGKVSNDTLRQHFRAEGLSDEQIARLLADKPTDDRSDDLKALDQTFAPGKAEDYAGRIAYIGRMPEGVDLAQFDTDARNFLASIAAPALQGASIVEEALDAGRAYARLPEAHRELHNQMEDQRLSELLGPEAAGQVNGKIVELLKSDGVPKSFVAWLVDSGALRSADVRYYLANVADLRGLRASVKAGASLDSLATA